MSLAGRTALTSVTALALAVAGCASRHDGSVHRYVIPAGTSAAVSQGRDGALPERIDLHVGDTLVIENHDERALTIGPFYVGAGETLRRRFDSRTELQGYCSLHVSSSIVISVH